MKSVSTRLKSPIFHIDIGNPERFEENPQRPPRPREARAGRIQLIFGAIPLFLDKLNIVSYFALWYALNVFYNIVNKNVLNVLPSPITVGGIQLGVGAVFVTLQWTVGFRKAPNLTLKGKWSVRKIGSFHAIGQLMTVYSLGAGTVSFTHIIKATEPFFSAVMSALFLGKWMKLQVYATLVPVVGGVGYACLNDGSFSWLALLTALGSNVSFAMRAVSSKLAMNDKIGDNISPGNLFGIVTVEAFFLSIPMMLFGEGLSFPELWSKAVGEKTDLTSFQLGRNIVVSGLLHYLNNEVMFLTLSKVHPVTLAVGNTMKRVFILVASVIFFHDPITLHTGVGSFVGLVGVLLYSLAREYYEKA